MIVQTAPTALSPTAPRPVGPVDPSSQGANARTDGFKPSAELQEPGQLGGSQLAAGIAGAQLDGILKSQAQQLIVAASQGVGDIQGMAEQLMKDYQKARETGAALSPETEALVKKALELVQGQGQGQNPAGANQAGGVPLVGGPSGPTGGGGNPSAPFSSGSPSGGGSPSNSGGGSPSSSAARPSNSTTSAPREATTPSSTTDSNGNGTVEASTDTNKNGNATATPEVPGAAEATDVFNNVAQGAPNNCGATSVIKQMQHQWGDEAMKFETQPDGTIKVTMRDGYTTTLTADQIQQAQTRSDYSGDDEAAREQAIRMNAAASARYADENNTTYEQGLDAINGRNWPDQVAPYFGIQANAVDPKTLDENGFAIVANNDHATNVMRTPRGGVFQDDHGDIQQRDNGRPRQYDGDIFSNGVNTGPAQYAWVLSDVGQASTAGKIAGVRFRDLKEQGYLDKFAMFNRSSDTGSVSAPAAGRQAASTTGSATAPGSGTTSVTRGLTQLDPARSTGSSTTPSVTGTSGSGSVTPARSTGSTGTTGTGSSGSAPSAPARSTGSTGTTGTGSSGSAPSAPARSTGSTRTSTKTTSSKKS